MSIPDFKNPLMLEINLARQINSAAYQSLPHENGCGTREDLASALAHIALEHISAILTLFSVGALSSGYALMRPALETAYKGIWIATVANDKDVARVHEGRDVYGDLKKIIAEIEAEFEDIGWATVFGKIRPHIRALHEQTHSGGEQTLRRLKSKDMRTPDYDFSRVISDIRTLAGASILVSVPVITTDDKNKLTALLQANYAWLAQNHSMGNTSNNES